MDITSDSKPSDTQSTLPEEIVDEPKSEKSPEATQSSDIGQENISPGNTENAPCSQTFGKFNSETLLLWKYHTTFDFRYGSINS